VTIDTQCCWWRQVRTSGDDLRKLLTATQALNTKYNAEIVTEFPFNGFGILEEVPVSENSSMYFYS